MPLPFIQRAMGDAGRAEPRFSLIKEEGHDGEIDDHWRPYDRQRPQHSHGHPKLWNAVYFISGLLIGVFGLLASQQATGSYHNPTFSNTGSQVPVIQTTFQRHELFAAPPSIESDRAWNSLMPFGDGFVVINDSGSLGLPPGIPVPEGEGERYDVSVFHQLHCLKQIRETLYITQIALNSTNAKNIDEMMIEPAMKHIYHCFDYIRQALMCAGDITLEWPRTEQDGQRFAVDGWGVVHQCKSWDAISEYITQNR